MANETLISFDLKANFASFKKPDYNVGLQLSYNMIHKPALLGVLGAIVGLEGYKKRGELPLYYNKLKHLLIGIEPLGHEKGNFQKTSVKYTNGVGYANADGNLIIEETMLINPAYRCFILLSLDSNIESKIYNSIMNKSSEFIPYLGKNEFQAWIDCPIEWKYKAFKASEDFTVDSLFKKSGTINKQIVSAEISFDFNLIAGSFTYFERLPVGFDEQLMQYKLSDFVFTDWKIRGSSKIPNLYWLKNADENKIIQLF